MGVDQLLQHVRTSRPRQRRRRSDKRAARKKRSFIPRGLQPRDWVKVSVLAHWIVGEVHGRHLTEIALVDRMANRAVLHPRQARRIADAALTIALRDPSLEIEYEWVSEIPSRRATWNDEDDDFDGDDT
jgi:hypothetical protein